VLSKTPSSRACGLLLGSIESRTERVLCVDLLDVEARKMHSLMYSRMTSRLCCSWGPRSRSALSRDDMPVGLVKRTTAAVAGNFPEWTRTSPPVGDACVDRRRLRVAWTLRILREDRLQKGFRRGGRWAYVGGTGEGVSSRTPSANRV